MPGEPSRTDLQASLAEIAAREADSRREATEANAWLAAIIENSNDAILSKTLDGIIMSWNAGAEKLFGHSAEEAIGQRITLIIPEDRLHEEEEIISKVRGGQRLEQFETVRKRKDGSLVDVALTISPVKDATGHVLGVSKIARDITPAKRASERQDLILRETKHRIKNLFTLATALVAISARCADTAEDLSADLIARFNALAHAHTLTLPDLTGDELMDSGTTLVALLEAILAPHDGAPAHRITIDGHNAEIGPQALPTLALVLHELATNAAKYGGLATPDGRLAISIERGDDQVHILWRESGAPERVSLSPSDGFGSRLEKVSLASLHGKIERVWPERGLEIAMQFPLKSLAR